MSSNPFRQGGKGSSSGLIGADASGMLWINAPYVLCLSFSEKVHLFCVSTSSLASGVGVHVTPSLKVSRPVSQSTVGFHISNHGRPNNRSAVKPRITRQGIVSAYPFPVSLMEVVPSAFTGRPSAIRTSSVEGLTTPPTSSTIPADTAFTVAPESSIALIFFPPALTSYCNRRVLGNPATSQGKVTPKL